ncbi:hypothetical protein C7H19_01685 [Aphanothece hegewaldii CCALA 016]|uniref:DUF4359 domain-containing protein n=1 Tax=Aphanothece hegewaldii CCALA 016 TaxID=2107694 RepID=A0A2T1M3V7_9CHRO|nr:DUF4359 domain-containing protein [Aphanothece hegewaldii]PSF39527.1 hypothetical protein C7H19_01685 [Aphanothece hegewaldii CCALA 016]
MKTIIKQKLGMNGNLIKGSVTVVILGVLMAATNPQQEAYTEYASDRLMEKSEKFVCQKTGYCDKDGMPVMVKNTVKNNLIKPAIDTTTERQNLGVISVYTTEIPGIGRMKTLGAFGKFITYSES